MLWRLFQKFLNLGIFYFSRRVSIDCRLVSWMVFPLFVIMSQPDSITISVSTSSELVVFSCVLVPVLFGILDPVCTRSGIGCGGIIALSSGEQLVRPAIMMRRKTVIFMGISDQKVENYSMQEIRNYKIYLLFLIIFIESGIVKANLIFSRCSPGPWTPIESIYIVFPIRKIISFWLFISHLHSGSSISSFTLCQKIWLLLSPLQREKP